MSLKQTQVFILGTIALLLVNLLQAGFTELLDDEAYYWMYSRHLDWGYFDHPPMIALGIKLGYYLFHNSLGVRLFSVLAMSISIIIMYALQNPFQPLRLICIILSIGLIQFEGFLASPDAALLLFSAVYLGFYHRYLKENSWLNATLLGIGMAGLMYSKYQGFLLIAITVLANPRLLLTRKYLASGAIGLLLLAPHVYWHYRHGFPALQYFLSDQYSTAHYKFHYTSDYLLAQLFFFGPLIGWMILFAAYSQKAGEDTWFRTLKLIVWGVIGFFFMATFKGRTEPNWTAITIFPGILLLHHYLDKAPKLEKVLYRLFPYSLLLIFLVRINFIWDFAGDKVATNQELHYNKVWTGFIRDRSKGFPVCFVNSYQRASKYIFYQQSLATCYNGVNYRNNQYDIWKLETNWYQDSVLVVGGWRITGATDSILTLQGKLYCKMMMNPKISGEAFYRDLPPRKTLTPFFKR